MTDAVVLAAVLGVAGGAGLVILLLLALNFLPKRTALDTGNVKRGADAFVATLAGLGVGILTYAILRRDFAFPSIAGYMVENSYKLGGGDNVVNVILVDFRALDTMGEIAVICFAAAGVWGMLRVRAGGKRPT